MRAQEFSVVTQQRISYTIEAKVKELLALNEELPPDHPDMLVARFYAAAPARARIAFIKQLMSALERSPFLRVIATRI